MLRISPVVNHFLLFFFSLLPSFPLFPPFSFFFFPLQAGLYAPASAEWLRRWTRNPLGSPRAGLNPADNGSI